MYSRTINQSAYVVATLCVIVLCVWSIVHAYTKTRDSPFFTDLHMTLSVLSGSATTLLLLTLIYRYAKPPA